MDLKIEEEMRRFEDEISSVDTTLPPPPMFKDKNEGGKSVNTETFTSPMVPPQISNCPNFGPFGFQNPPNNGPMPMNNPRPMPNNFINGPRPMFNNGPPPHFAMGPRPMQPPMGGPPRFMPPAGMPFIPLPQMDFSGLPEKKSVYSSAPVLKKPKLEDNEKDGVANDQVQIGPEKSSSSVKNELPVCTKCYSYLQNI